MKLIRYAILVVMVLLPAAFLAAQTAEVVYFQGTANLKGAAGTVEPVDFGTTMKAGDTIITGPDGTVQLDENGVNQITVQPNSVFSLKQRVQDSAPRTVMTTVLGAVSFKFRQLAGTAEPDIATLSSVAGVRGTAFTVYAGNDGSSLFVVQEGKVAVQAGGRTVDLLPNEAVQVNMGNAPGQKYTVQYGKVDFSRWSAERAKAFQTDPVASLAAVGRRMAGFIEEIHKLEPDYKKLSDEAEAGHAQYKKYMSEGKKEEAKTLFETKLGRLDSDRTNVYLNIRYWAMSALSLRKYVMGSMYLTMKLKYLSSPQDSTFAAFMDEYMRIEAQFEAAVGKYVSDIDI